MSKVLIIGSGGREHALAWKFSCSPQVDEVFAAPGSAGMESVATRVNIAANDFKGLAGFARSNYISLTVVGPEVPLMGGIVDYFLAEGLAVFGPRANAAAIEGSKSFARDIMLRYNIPTAASAVFSDYDAARAYIGTQKPPYVVKADGLAQGKGVVIAETLGDAENALREMMREQRFGAAGTTVVIQEFLTGVEFSYMAFVNGKNVFPMLPAKDHKRAFDGDEGPNTGGMGGYCPVPGISEEVLAEAREKILLPIAEAMVKEGIPFTGVLFAGLIATEKGPKVIEFNARFGDPETGLVLPLLDNDLYAVITSVLKGGAPVLSWSKDNTIGVVLASKGYPGKYETGFPISGLDSLESGTYLFHSGTEREEAGFVTKGGRVLFAVRKADNLYTARERLYNTVKNIKCDNLYHRKDI